MCTELESVDYRRGWLLLLVGILACGANESSIITESTPPQPTLSLASLTSWPPEGDLQGSVVFGGQVGGEGQVDFYLAQDGSYRFEDSRGLAVYDFGSATAKSLAFGRDGDPDFGAVLTGHPLASPETPHAFLNAYLKWDLRGFCLASVATGSEVAFLGLEAAEVTVPGPSSEGDESGPIESVTYICDRATGLPLSIIEVRSGQPTVAYEVLGLTDAEDPPSFDIEMPTDGEVVMRDLGFSREALEGVAGVVGYEPVVPGYIPRGFELAEVSVAAAPEAGTTTGFERVNPPSVGIVVLVYKNGLSELVVSSRVSDPRPNVNDVWTDPYGVSMTSQDMGSVFAPSLSAEFELGVGLGSPLHGWAVVDDLVVSVGGDVPADELQKVIAELE